MPLLVLAIWHVLNSVKLPGESSVGCSKAEVAAYGCDDVAGDSSETVSCCIPVWKKNYTHMYIHISCKLVDLLVGVVVCSVLGAN